MGYFLYTRRALPSGDEYQRLRECPLGGGTNGIICRHLRTLVGSATTQPWPWRFLMSDALKSQEPDAQTFVIDLKPSNVGNVSLYAVRQVWGYSAYDWTPVMLELETLLGDEDPANYDKRHFTRPRGEPEQVFTFLYLSGSVANGQLTGTWNFPRPSSTNSVLLWRYALDYFAEEAGYVGARREAAVLPRV